LVEEGVGREAGSTRSTPSGSGSSSHPMGLQPGQQLASNASDSTGGPPSGADQSKPMTNILQEAPIHSSAMETSTILQEAPIHLSAMGTPIVLIPMTNIPQAASRPTGWSNRVFDSVQTSFKVQLYRGI
jgi:hypothetical protein